MNEQSLIKLLQENIGKNIIINNQPDKSNTCLIRKIELFEYFNDSQLEKYFKISASTFKLNEFIEYMIYANKSTNTKGLYHQYMPYMNAYYNISTNRSGFPDYSNLDDTISKKIISSRIEYSILYGLLHFIKNDKFLKNKIKLTYQFKLDNKYFDACIPELKILIEIQEDKDNHDNKASDNHKKLIAKFNEYNIIYFHESDLKKDEMSLRNFFHNKFKKIVYGAMSYFKKELMIPIIRELYVEKLQEDLKEATSMLRKNKIIENIKLFENNEIFNKLIEKRFTNNQEKYFLTLDDIYSLYPDLEKNNDFKKDITENLLFNKIIKDNVYYFEWSMMNYVIVEYSDTKNDCANYLKFLTELDGLYKTLLIYNNEYLEQCKINHQECNEYYSKLESDELIYYKHELKSTEKRLIILEHANQTIIEKFKLNSFLTNLKKILESPFKKSSKSSLNTILTSMKSVQESVKLIQESNITTEIKCQKIVGKSILENISEFPYVYNPESEGVSYKQLYADMKINLISDTDIYAIIKQFCPFFNQEKTEIIYNISLSNTNDNKFSINEIENLLEQTHIESEEESESENESDSDNNLEEADF
jgi:hypothetical protein